MAQWADHNSPPLNSPRAFGGRGLIALWGRFFFCLESPEKCQPVSLARSYVRPWCAAAEHSHGHPELGGHSPAPG